jgi:hypothetical protein
LFRDAAAETGLRFHHFTGAAGRYYMPEIMGSGAALLDYDNDGDLDVYLVQGAPLEPGGKPLFPPPVGWQPGNRLFRNELVPSGTLRFTDVTAAAGVGHIGYGMGAATGDFDGDGFLDLYVTNFGANVLYRNTGDGAFRDVTREAGAGDPRWSSSASFVDYDRDGRLDLFVANYVDFTVRGNKRCYAATGELDYCTPKVYRPVPSRLLRNLGGGRFEDATERAGIGAAYGPGLGVVAADFNGDGWPDFYVANDTAANLLWLNQRNGAFREAALESGAAYAADGMARAGMGVSAADFDGDGDDDIVVTNLTREGLTLFRNDGKGAFEDATLQFGLAEPTFPYTGFGAAWFDADNDGRLDLFLANGAVTIMESQRGSPYPFRQRNQLLQNPGDGRRFVERTAAAGPGFELQEASRAAAFGDLDNDGDIDIVVANNNGPARLLLNETPSRRHWLTVRLEAAAGNRLGLGARVAVLRPGAPPLWRRAHTDGSYLSAGDCRVHFGLGDTAAVDVVLVEWPDGTRERFQSIPPDCIVTLRKGRGVL